MWRPTEIFRKNPAASNAGGTRSRASASPSRGHESARIGKWGEDIAACFLRNHGWDIVGRRVRPCKRDQRCEIDVIARSHDKQTVLFVEVKTHAMRSPRAAPLWGVNRRKKNVLLRNASACCLTR